MKNIREFEVTHYHNNKRSIKKSTRFFPITKSHCIIFICQVQGKNRVDFSIISVVLKNQHDFFLALDK